MQYLLTEEEYDALVEAPDTITQELNKVIKELCIQVADNLPVKAFSEEKSPWGCPDSPNNRRQVYCDKCPVQDLCPSKHKHWSK